MNIIEEKSLIPALRILTTTRSDGCSENQFAYFNLSYDVMDNNERVEKNRFELVNELKIKNLSLIKDCPNCLVKKVISSEIDEDPIHEFEESMLYTFSKDISLGALHADNQAIIIYSYKRLLRACALVSLETSINEAIISLIRQLKSEHINPRDLFVYFSPALSFSHTIITEEIKNKVDELGYTQALKTTNNIDYLDIPLLNVLQLEKEGIPFRNIKISPYCTYENTDIFYSEAIEKQTGRMITLITSKTI